MTKKEKDKKIKEKFAGKQTFKNSEGKVIKLSDFLQEGDWWESKGRGTKKHIITHDAVKRIAKEAGLKALRYAILTQPSVENNYQITISSVVIDTKTGEEFLEIGESNRNNIGARGKQYPAKMAQKRAFDINILSILGMSGLLSEEELDEEQKEHMDKLSIDEQKEIATFINKINLTRTKDNLFELNRDMSKDAKEGKMKKYNEAQLDYLRALYKKKVAELQKVSF